MVRLFSALEVPSYVFSESSTDFGIKYHFGYVGCNPLFCVKTPFVYGAAHRCPYVSLHGYRIQFDKVCVQYWNIRMLSISSPSSTPILSAELLIKESPIVLITAW